MRAVNSTLSAIAALAFIGVASIDGAQATTVTWDFTDGCPVNCGTDGSNGNTRTFLGSDGLTSVTASAWARTVNSTNVVFETAFLGQYSHGLGVTDRDEGSGGYPHHTMDNVSRLNIIAFHFDSLVEPTAAFLTGFASSIVSDDPDTDISVWVGNVAGAVDLTGLTLGDLDTMFGGHIDNAGPNGQSTRLANFGTGESGNLLIIGASVSDTSPEDLIKIGIVKAEVTTPPGDVPDVVEPASLAMFGLGVLGMVRLRRRKAAA